MQRLLEDAANDDNDAEVVPTGDLYYTADLYDLYWGLGSACISALMVLGGLALRWLRRRYWPTLIPVGREPENEEHVYEAVDDYVDPDNNNPHYNPLGHLYLANPGEEDVNPEYVNDRLYRNDRLYATDEVYHNGHVYANEEEYRRLTDGEIEHDDAVPEQEDPQPDNDAQEESNVAPGHAELREERDDNVEMARDVPARPVFHLGLPDVIEVDDSVSVVTHPWLFDRNWNARYCRMPLASYQPVADLDVNVGGDNQAVRDFAGVGQEEHVVGRVGAREMTNMSPNFILPHRLRSGSQ